MKVFTFAALSYREGKDRCVEWTATRWVADSIAPDLAFA
jgi:hypothetical protein